MNLYFKTPVKGTVKDVFNQFNESLFSKLKPPGVKVEIVRFDGCKKGDAIDLNLISPMGKQQWKGEVTDWFSSEEECYFVDEGRVLPFPLSAWKHKHLIKSENNQTFIIDDIQFEIKPAIIGIFYYPILWSVFKYRGPIYRRIFS